MHGKGWHYIARDLDNPDRWLTGWVDKALALILEYTVKKGG